MPAKPSPGHDKYRTAERSALFAALNDQWTDLADSRQLRHQLTRWSASHRPLAAFSSGETLMATLHDVTADEDLRRDLLEAVATEAPTNDLAMTVTLVALMPRLASMVNATRSLGIDLDERCATVLSMAHEVVLGCRPGTARSWYDRRLWCNISKRYHRWINTQLTCAHRELLRSEEISNLSGFQPEPVTDDFALAELCDWVAEQASVDLETASLVVLTRAGGVLVEDIVRIEGSSGQTVRRRRHRAERRLVAALASNPDS